MTTQVFRGKTLLDAREQAFQALGRGAVILTTREVRRAGLGGVFGGTDVEVAAAVVGRPDPEPSRTSERPFAHNAYMQGPARPAATTEERDSIAALRAEVRCEMRALKLAMARAPAAPDSLMTELAGIRELLDQVAPTSRADRVAKFVASRGIEGAAATAVARAMRALPASGEAPGEALRASLETLIAVAPWPLAKTGRTLIAAVGPTGVGKTTTIAKLATLAKIDKKTVTLVTTDTFRVGGVEQIKRYAHLLDVRHEVARDAQALTALISSSTADVLLVDTSGRSLKSDAAEALLSSERFASLKGSSGVSRQVLLCLPASVRWVDAVRATKAYAAAGPVAVAVTKTDETDAPGGVVHAALASRLPVSVFCTGPHVPEDIEAATSSSVFDRVSGNTSKKGAVR
jgi:flagellar biosynthesis protein FlhF